MFGTWRSWTAAVWVALLGAGWPAAPELPAVTREEAIATARAYAEHHWVCGRVNTKALCVRGYRSSWVEGQAVTGLAYNWGGMDDPATFDRRLSGGAGAGAHERDGVTRCTAGVDCSGLVSACWGQKHKYGTADIAAIADDLKIDVFKQLKPGDALNNPGSHIVLFTAYNQDGTVSVYEASGSESRVVLSRRTWSWLRKYKPIRYKHIVE